MAPTQVRQEQLRGGLPEYENLKVELADLRDLVNSVVASASDTASSSDVGAINARIDAIEVIVNDLIAQSSDASITLEYLVAQSSDFSEFLISETTPQGLSISYDGTGQISSVLFDDGREIVVTYDVSGNIDRVTSSDYAKQFIYSSDGQLTAVDIV